MRWVVVLYLSIFLYVKDDEGGCLVFISISIGEG